MRRHLKLGEQVRAEVTEQRTFIGFIGAESP